MLNVGPQQWAEWKRNNVTLAVMDSVRSRIEESKDQLLGATNDRDYDQFVKGMIRAFYEVLDVQLELTTEENEDEVSARDTGSPRYS